VARVQDRQEIYGVEKEQQVEKVGKMPLISSMQVIEKGGMDEYLKLAKPSKHSRYAS
jgi:hypothetical protein